MKFPDKRRLWIPAVPVAYFILLVAGEDWLRAHVYPYPGRGNLLLLVLCVLLLIYVCAIRRLPRLVDSEPTAKRTP